MQTPLHDAVVVVTGAARGIGRATAAAFAAHGARVALGDLDEEMAAAAAAEIGDRAVGFGLDVASPDSYEKFLERVRKQLGPIDVLVSNAGIMPVGALVDHPLTTSRATIDINLWGVVLGCHLVLPDMIARGRGQVINVASALGRVAGGGVAVYSATKFGVVGFTHALQQELQNSGVAATAVLPGVVRTELSSGVPEHRTPVSRPADVAAAVVKSAIKRPAEVSIPAQTGPLLRILAALSPRLRQPILRRMDYDRALHAVDTTTRVDYRARLARVTGHSGAEDGGEQGRTDG